MCNDCGQTSVTVMLPRVAFEYGHTSWAFSISDRAVPRSTLGMSAEISTMIPKPSPFLPRPTFAIGVSPARTKLRAWGRVVVHGCGGVGLSAVMIAVAAGARVVAVDVSPGALDLARKFGAAQCLDATAVPDTAAAVRELTGGAHLSLDALGSPGTCAASVNGLRRRGRHVQVGLLPSPTGTTPVPMARAIALELELLGSHGMAAHSYPPMLELVRSGVLRPDLLVTSTIALDEVPAALAAMGTAPGAGATVIEPWS